MKSREELIKDLESGILEDLVRSSFDSPRNKVAESKIYLDEIESSSFEFQVDILKKLREEKNIENFTLGKEENYSSHEIEKPSVLEIEAYGDQAIREYKMAKNAIGNTDEEITLGTAIVEYIPNKVKKYYKKNHPDKARETEKQIQKKSKENKIIPPDFPDDLKWEEITLQFINGHEVIIKYRGETIQQDYELMEMKDGRSKFPNDQWHNLIDLSENYGKPSRKINFSRKAKQSLSDSLKNYFGIQEDPFRKIDGSYEIKIVLIPEKKDEEDRLKSYL